MIPGACLTGKDTPFAYGNHYRIKKSGSVMSSRTRYMALDPLPESVALYVCTIISSGKFPSILGVLNSLRTDFVSSPYQCPVVSRPAFQYPPTTRGHFLERGVEMGLMMLGCMGLLYFGAMIAPGVGLSGSLMVRTPSEILEWAHAPGYGILAWLMTSWLQRREWPFPYALAVGSAAALVFGLWTEVFQGTVPGRQTSADDLVVDAIGIVSAGTLAVCLALRGQQVPAPVLPSSPGSKGGRLR